MKILRILFIGAAASILWSANNATAKDVAVPAADLRALVVGKTINSAGAKLKYGADGRYTYNGANPGKFTISNGKICVKFDAGDSRCDRIVKSADRYYLINSGGKRFPFN